MRALAAEVAGAFRELLQLNHRLGRIQVSCLLCMPLWPASWVHALPWAAAQPVRPAPEWEVRRRARMRWWWASWRPCGRATSPSGLAPYLPTTPSTSRACCRRAGHLSTHCTDAQPIRGPVDAVFNILPLVEDCRSIMLGTQHDHCAQLCGQENGNLQCLCRSRLALQHRAA